ncbi:MAG TPA: S9 family peptidase [Terriglobia bacterium]|nr:S9 family peptidase [Terriglobia bacterium]
MKRSNVVPAALLAFAVWFTWPATMARAQNGKKRLTAEIISHGDRLVAPGIFALAWRPGAHELTYIRRQGSGKDMKTSLMSYDAESKQERTLLQPSAGDPKLNLFSYQWSPQGDRLLLDDHRDLWLVDAASGAERRLTDDPEEKEDATFSPTGDRMAFVERNNIYSIDLKTGLLKQLTTDGNVDVLDGKLDWVYEEELANRATGRAYEWSPDGKIIAYLRLDDSPVPKYPLTHYLETHVSLTEERFPQAGDPNPLPSLHAVSVETGDSKSWTLSLHDSSLEYFGPSLTWTPDSKSVSFLTMNRAQNELKVRLWDVATGTDRVLLTEKDPYWINSLDPPRFLADGRFLWLSERDGWLHLYLCGADGDVIKQLTSGNWMIDHPAFSNAPMFQVDDKTGWVYFASTNPDPRERQVYRVRVDGGAMERLTQQPGSHSFDVSPDGGYFVDTFSNLETPPETRLLKSSGAAVATISKWENHLDEYTLGKTEFVEVKARDGATLYARLLKPADFNPKKKYPVIVDVYGGPHVQMIQNRFGVTGLEDQLFAQEGFLVWQLDNRGSWGRGHAWESAIFEHMGQHELADQLDGVAYLKSLPFVDAHRLAIWGWSYGGYMTLYALTHAPDVFKCGAAGGPVTDWKFYDSIYTERYMRTPGENPEGYKDSSPLEAADKLKAKVLIIHGTDDDNVHMQNTMNFLAALVNAQHPFELYIQPGQKHGFQGEAIRDFLSQRLVDFFKQNL